MRFWLRSSFVRPAVAWPTAALALLAWSAGAAEGPAWSVAQGEVRVVCPMTVGGSFEAKTTSLRGSVTLAAAQPAAFSGDFSVDLRTLDTGIGLRDDHLRDEYLEVGKGEDFAKAVLSDVHLGGVDAGSFQGKTAFTGTFALHGARRPITGKTEIRREGSSVRVEASFPVTLTDYGIAKPQYLGVGVKDEVEVKVSLVARSVTTQATGASR